LERCATGLDRVQPSGTPIAIPPLKRLAVCALHTAYPHYRVRFPTVRNAPAANSMQLAEMELLRWQEITSPNDHIVIQPPAGALDVRGAARLIDHNLGLTNKLEVSGINNQGMTTVYIVPAMGQTILKGFEIIGAADDAAYPGRRPSMVRIYGDASVPLAAVTPIAPLGNSQIQEFTVQNDTPYAYYTIVFHAPVGGDRLQVGELRLFGEAVVVPPTLTIRPSGLNVEVSWLHAAGFELIHKATLDDATCLPVTTPPVLINGTNTVTIAMTATTGFFRLRKP